MATDVDDHRNRRRPDRELDPPRDDDTGDDDGPTGEQIHHPIQEGMSRAATVSQGTMSQVYDRLTSPFFRHRRQTVTLLSLVVLALLFYLALGQLNFSGATS